MATRSRCLAVSALLSLAPLAQAQWDPGVWDLFNIQLTGQLKLNLQVDAYELDLFDTPVATIDSLRARGTNVICYFSGGSSENWRPDFSRFKPSDMGNPLDPKWPGERWLDTRSSNVRAIMKSRLDLAVSKHCDAVDPDNVDGYTNKPGFPLTFATQLDYNKFLANEAHARGLAIALKNDVDQLAELGPYYDMAVNEQCHQYNECGGYTASFISQGKPVFNVEYAAKYRNNTNGARDQMCAQARAQNMRTLVMDGMLAGKYRFSCDD